MMSAFCRHLMCTYNTVLFERQKDRRTTACNCMCRLHCTLPPTANTNYRSVLRIQDRACINTVHCKDKGHNISEATRRFTQHSSTGRSFEGLRRGERSWMHRSFIINIIFNRHNVHWCLADAAFGIESCWTLFVVCCCSRGGTIIREDCAGCKEEKRRRG